MGQIKDQVWAGENYKEGTKNIKDATKETRNEWIESNILSPTKSNNNKW